MATKTISLAEDAYDRLAAEKREGESFSDVVRRLTAGVSLAAFHGVLSPETATDLEDAIEATRTRHAAERVARVDRFVDDWP